MVGITRICLPALIQPLFSSSQCLHQLGTDIHLLDLIASGCANDAGRLLALAELKALDAHIFSVGRMYGINISLKHNLFTPSGSAPADLLHRPPDKLSRVNNSPPFCGTDLLLHRPFKWIHHFPIRSPFSHSGCARSAAGTHRLTCCG